MLSFMDASPEETAVRETPFVPPPLLAVQPCKAGAFGMAGQFNGGGQRSAEDAVCSGRGRSSVVRCVGRQSGGLPKGVDAAAARCIHITHSVVE